MPSSRDRYQTALIAPSSRSRTSSNPPSTYGAGSYEHQRYLSSGKAPARRSTSLEPHPRGKSDAYYRAATGLPRPTLGRHEPSAGYATSPELYGDNRVRHSSYFRDQMNPKVVPREVRDQSPFGQTYNGYKHDEPLVKPQKQAYNRYLNASPELSSAQRQDHDTYRGKPRASREWHAGAERLATIAADTGRRATAGRQQMAENYIAYESHDNRERHLYQLGCNQNQQAKLDKKVRNHRGLFG